MPRLYNNKILSITFGVLLLLWLVTRLWGRDSNDRNFRTDLVTIDTASVNRVVLYPQEGEEVTFTEQDNRWMVSQGDISAQADQQAVQSVLGTLLQLKPQRLAARNEEGWDTFEVTDSLGTRVRVYQDDNLLSDLIVGKFSLQQVPMQPGANPMQQPRPKATSYVRLTNESEVYAVDGFLTSAFNRQFNSWRDRSFLQLNGENVTRISFQYPGDSSYTLSKTDSSWMAANSPADSTQTAQYLNQISSLSSSDFADGISLEGRSPAYQARIEGNNMSPVTIEAFPSDSTFILRNSTQPEVVVRSDSSGLFSRVFKPASTFSTVVSQ